MEDQESGALEIRQYIALFRRWLWLIALCAVLGAGVAFVWSRAVTPVYEASTTLLVSEGQRPTGSLYGDVSTSERLAQTYGELLRSKPLLEAVGSRLGATEPVDVSVAPVDSTQIIRLRVRHTDPQLAAAYANAIPEAFIQQNEETQSSRIASSMDSLRAELQRVQADLDATQASLDAERAKAAPNGAEVTRLEDLLAQQRTSYTSLLQSYEELRVTQAWEQDTLSVVEPATVPEKPASPRTLTNVILATVVGAMLAVAVAFLVEYLDDTIKRPEDVERTVGVAPIGTIARHAGEPEGALPLMAGDPQSAIAEAYRMLRTNVEFSVVGLQRAAVTLLVTSAEPGEGKTTTAANLAVALAQSGKRVLLVEADLRRPTLHQRFQLPNERGLTTLYLERGLSPAAVIQPTDVPRLSVLTSGPLPSNPAELLSYPQTARLLTALQELADYVLLDSSPVLSVADPSILAQRVDGVLVVVQAGHTRTDAFTRALAALQTVKAQVLGVVLNRMAARAGSYYDYYGAEGRKQRRRWPVFAGGRAGLALHLALILLAVAGVLALAAELVSQGWVGGRAEAAVLPTAVAEATTTLAAMPEAGATATMPATAVPVGAALSPSATVVAAEPPQSPVAALPKSTAAPWTEATASRSPTLVAAQPPPTLVAAQPPRTVVAASPAARYGVSASLRLRDGRSTYAVGEPVPLAVEVRNNLSQLTSIGFVGLDVAGLPFHTTWSQVDLGPGAAYSGEDQLVFSTPGTYTVSVAACFSGIAACQEPGSGDWATYPGGVTVTVQ